MGNEGKTRRYYSARKAQKTISPSEAHWRLDHLFTLFRGRDYFRAKLGISGDDTPKSLVSESVIKLGFKAFPLSSWEDSDKTETNIFDVTEFLYDHVSKPGDMIDMVSESNWHYQDYESFDEEAGKSEFRSSANLILSELGEGFELGADGEIRANGSGGLQHILKAEIVPFDKENVDNKVIAAIEKWRHRASTLEDKKEAIRLLADVFEWLKDTKQLSAALVKKDESDLFNIANSFSIRHHEHSQKSNYDRAIWYNWMFHFYLATYHAVIRMIVKEQKAAQKRVTTPSKHHL